MALTCDTCDYNGKDPRFVPWRRNVSQDGRAPRRLFCPPSPTLTQQLRQTQPPTGSIELMVRMIDPLTQDALQMRMCHYKHECQKKQCVYMHSIDQVLWFFARPDTIEFYRAARLVRSPIGGSFELARYETPRHFKPRERTQFVVHRNWPERNAGVSHQGLPADNSCLLESRGVDFYVALFDEQFRLIQPELTLVCPRCARRVVVPIYV